MQRECKALVYRNHMVFVIFLFFFFYLTLPEYFAFEVSESLPLITVSRILLICYVASYLIIKQGKMSTRLCDNLKIERAIYLYIICMAIVNVLNIYLDPAATIKEIFSLILEKLLVVYVISKTITTRKHLLYALRVLSYSSGVVALITIIGCLLGVNYFYYLTTTKRNMLQASFVRLGILRAEAGFGHAVYYGAYCLLMLIITFYLLKLSRNKSDRILLRFVLVLNTVALLLCNSRGSLMAGLIVCAIYIIRNSRRKINANTAKAIILICLLCLVALLNSEVRQFVSNISLSIIAIFDKSVELKDYGANVSGMKSRLAQLQCFPYVFLNRPLTGFGAKVIERQSIIVNWLGNKSPLTTIDMGIVYTVSQFGFLGLLAEIHVYYTLVRHIITRAKNDVIYELFFMLILSYLIVLLTISGIDNVIWVLFGLNIAYINISHRERAFISNLRIQKNDAGQVS